MENEVDNLQEMLDRIDRATDHAADAEQPVSLERVVAEVGGRSFGSILLFLGLIMISPLCSIPGMPTTLGLLVLLVSIQLLFRKKQLWLPGWLLRRAVQRSRVRKALRHLRGPARFVDRLVKPRLAALVEGTGAIVIALTCSAIALCMPFMEVIPFSVHGAGVAVTAFGLATTSRDGIIALLAFLATAGTFGPVLYHVFT